MLLKHRGIYTLLKANVERQNDAIVTMFLRCYSLSLTWTCSELVTRWTLHMWRTQFSLLDLYDEFTVQSVARVNVTYMTSCVRNLLYCPV